MKKCKTSLTVNSCKGMVLGVLTSGANAQGMNAVLFATVRMSIYLGFKIYIIYDGYIGLIEGGSYIKESNWSSVYSIIYSGGTIIGLSRCEQFLNREGRLKAAYNLVTNNITNLVIIGDKDSLHEGDLFREEWCDLLTELVKYGKISQKQKDLNNIFHIVGIVASIDNDFCGADTTIGTDSALHRITEAIDAIVSTAYSHQRTFIMEVIGKNCGYVAVCTALATEADFLFIPEKPASVEWKKKLCNKINMERVDGRQRLNILIVAEGAIDREGNPITAEDVKKVVVDELQQDTRITVLGHVQRGGNPSAFDRVWGCRLGAEAVLVVMEKKEESTAICIALHGNAIVRLSLSECIARTNAVAKAMKEKKWNMAVKLRSPNYQHYLDIYETLNQLAPRKLHSNVTQSELCKFAVILIGSPSCGMNAVVRSFVRSCISRGDVVYAIYGGIDGLLDGNFKEMEWSSVTGWAFQGGANLGTNTTLPETKFQQIAARFKEYSLNGFLIIGGFEAYHAAGQFYEQRKNYTEFCIPILVVPSSISNNIPGTELSLGCDTSLNEITEMIDGIRKSSLGVKGQVFIVGTMGGYCGYLATLSGLACAAHAAYIYEEKFNIDVLEKDCKDICAKISSGCTRGFIIRNENASKNYSTDFIRRLFTEEGKGLFSCRMNILGHMQQGGTPSPFDRINGTQMGVKSFDWFNDQIGSYTNAEGVIYCNTPESACLIGIIRQNYKFSTLEELLPQTNFDLKIPTKQWWMKLRPFLKILTRHSSSFVDGTTSFSNDDDDESFDDSIDETFKIDDPFDEVI